MDFKGTIGKWKVFTNVHKECNGDEWGWVGLDTFNSKSIKKCTIHWSGEEAKANALLISKAPEMLEMLKKCKIMCDHLNIHHVSNELNALINEATEL